MSQTTISTSSPWTSVYGLGRTVLAVGTFATLACNPSSLFLPSSSLPRIPVASWSLFHAVDPDLIEPARWIALAVLALVIVGWRPRWTGIAHWWVTWSVSISCQVPDGGDQIAGILTALLIPITLTDPRRSHWNHPAVRKAPLRTAIAASSFLVIRLQMAVIYLHAATEKLHVTEWLNGTALYYWLTHPGFGLPRAVEPPLVKVLAVPGIVVTLTWAVIVLELLLAAGLVMDRKWWRPLLVAGLVFHAGIWLVHGLGSFFFAMAGGLILYLRPADAPFAPPSARSFRWHAPWGARRQTTTATADG